MYIYVSHLPVGECTTHHKIKHCVVKDHAFRPANQLEDLLRDKSHPRYPVNPSTIPSFHSQTSPEYLRIRGFSSNDLNHACSHLNTTAMAATSRKVSAHLRE